MILAPLILFVYNRLWHTQQTVESLLKNHLASESDLFIFSDGAKNEKDKLKVIAVRDYIKTISGFRSIIINESNKNYGLANSVINGVSKILSNSEIAIIVEDDLISGPNFLSFMNEALRFYKQDFKIFSVSGYSYPITIPQSYDKDIYILPRTSSWGWGTWYDRWNKADWDVMDYKQFLSDTNAQKKFNEGGTDLTPMLKSQMAGDLDSWGIRWAYTHFKNNAFCLYPVKSLCKNIGNDSTGTHSRKSDKYEVQLSNQVKFNFIHDLELNSEILGNVKSFARPGLFRRILNYYKR